LREFFLKSLSETYRINNQIRVREVRVVDEEGKNLGVFPIDEAIQMAKDQDVDLIEVSARAVPPIAKLMEYGKFLYIEKKKAKEHKGSATTETKSLQVKIGTGEHDLELKAKKATEFLKDGHRIKIDLFLPGRAKYLKKEFLEERLKRLLDLIGEEYKLADGPTKSPKGLSVVIERGKKKV
jgi:translation initiation factor IF-3